MAKEPDLCRSHPIGRSYADALSESGPLFLAAINAPIAPRKQNAFKRAASADLNEFDVELNK
jgi:hypothetical protein